MVPARQLLCFEVSLGGVLQKPVDEMIDLLGAVETSPARFVPGMKRRTLFAGRARCPWA
jgi:hypothetical protein